MRSLMLTLFLALATWSKMGKVHAHEDDSQGGDLHFIGLSSGAPVPVLVAACCIVVFFMGVFLLKWRQSATETSETGNDDGTNFQENGGG